MPTVTAIGSPNSPLIHVVVETPINKTVRFANAILGSEYSHSQTSCSKGAGGKMLFVQLMFFAFTLTWSLMNGAGSGEKALMQIKLKNCNNYADVPPSISQSAGPISFTLYFQLVNGMCVKENMYETDPSQDCFRWSDGVYWNHFADTIRNDYLASQAHEMVTGGYLSFYILMGSGIAISILEMLQKIHNGLYVHLTDESSWCKWSITMTVTFAKLIGAFVTFLFGAILLAFARSDGRPNGNQVVIGENWDSYYMCQDVSTSMLEGASNYNSAVILASFSFVGFIFGMCTLCCFTKPDDDVLCCWNKLREERRQRDVEMNRV